MPPPSSRARVAHRRSSPTFHLRAAATGSRQRRAASPPRLGCRGTDVAADPRHPSSRWSRARPSTSPPAPGATGGGRPRAAAPSRRASRSRPTSELALDDEATELRELLARPGVDRRTPELPERELEPPIRLLGGIGPAPARSDELRGFGDLVLAQLDSAEQVTEVRRLRRLLPERGDDGKGALPLPEVVPRRLPRELRAAPDAELVVDGLERDADVDPEPAERLDDVVAGACENGADSARTREKRAGFRRVDGQALFDCHVDSPLSRHVLRLTGDHARRRVDEQGCRPRPRARRFSKENLRRQARERVAREDRACLAEEPPRGRTVMPLVVSVHD